MRRAHKMRRRLPIFESDADIVAAVLFNRSSCKAKSMTSGAAVELRLLQHGAEGYFAVPPSGAIAEPILGAAESALGCSAFFWSCTFSR